MEGFNHNPDDQSDPWLPADATQTFGNHVDAYVDFHDPSGFQPASGEFRASVSAPGVFDYTYDTAGEPLANEVQSIAAIVQAFYTTNWLHDWWYDSGFKEAAGAARTTTSAAAGSTATECAWRCRTPRTRRSATARRCTRPSTASRRGWSWPCSARRASPPSSTSRAGRLVRGRGRGVRPQGVRPLRRAGARGRREGTPSDACQPIVNDVAGKIVLIDRGGGCIFVPKAETALAAGAAGVILVNNKPGDGSFRPGRRSAPRTRRSPRSACRWRTARRSRRPF
ncbi:PA domain-containing protein [Nannocystis pusilla]|uniref:PA domain-containing protein n=1 Tax=Nannocystis pusilla TaxID=889268 RepID=UPI003B825DB6